MQSEDEVVDEPIEEEDQSVNGDVNVTKPTEDENVINEDVDPKEQENTNVNQVNIATNKTGKLITKGINQNVIDPGGTGMDVTRDVVVNTKLKESAKSGNKQMTQAQLPGDTGNTGPVEITQLKNKKNTGEQAMITKPKKSSIVAALGDK